MADSTSTTGTTATTVQPPPPPPRLTGVPEQDLLIVAAHLNEIYQNGYINFQVTKKVTGYDPNSFDPSKLPDPASTTLGQAQKTANDAYILANAATQVADAAKALAETANNRTKDWTYGTTTCTGTAGVFTVTLPTAQPDANYEVVFQCKDFTGTPPFGATQVVKYTTTAANFTLTLNDPPGTGNVVTLHWALRR